LLEGVLALNVQYGCGLSAPDGWLNFDASPTLRLQRLPIIGSALTSGRARFPAAVRYGDVIRGLPVAPASAARVYCSHVLEHLSLEDCRKALRETRRILQPGGIFRGVLPDLETLARAYLADASAGAASTFMRETLLGTPSRARGLRAVTVAIAGNSEHLWMWDYKAMAAELAAAGFNDVRRAAMGDSGDAAFAAVEDKSRWDGCLGFECKS
jgi:SAM-dependent methyltransferase